MWTADGSALKRGLLDALRRLGTADEEFREAERLVKLPYGGMFAEMEKCSAVGPALRDEDLLALGIQDRAPGTYYAALRVPAMGDAKAPDVAQMVHQHTLRKAGLLEDSAWMRLSHGFCAPTGRCWEGVYIDDHATVSIIRADQAVADTAERPWSDVASKLTFPKT